MPLDAGLLEAKERAEAAFGQKEDTHRAGPGRGAPWCRPFGGGGAKDGLCASRASAGSGASGVSRDGTPISRMR